MGNCAFPTGYKCAEAVGKICNLGHGPFRVHSVDERSGKRIAGSHGVHDLNRVARRFDVLATEKHRTSGRAACNTNPFPSVPLAADSTKILDRPTRLAE